MKQIILTTILVLTSYLSGLAQTDENPCRKIIIKAPEMVRPNENFMASASFEKETQPSDSKFNWIILKDNEVVKRSIDGIIDIDSKNLERGGIITLLAVDLNEKCRNIEIANILVVPNVGSPYIIDEYSELEWNDEKARLDGVVIPTEKNKDAEIFAFLDFDKKTSQAERRSYISKILNHFSTRKLERNKITLLISEADRKRIRYQLVPKEFSTYYPCDCLAIRAEDFEKLESLFKR